MGHRNTIKTTTSYTHRHNGGGNDIFLGPRHHTRRSYLPTSHQALGVTPPSRSTMGYVKHLRHGSWNKRIRSYTKLRNWLRQKGGQHSMNIIFNTLVTSQRRKGRGGWSYASINNSYRRWRWRWHRRGRRSGRGHWRLFLAFRYKWFAMFQIILHHLCGPRTTFPAM